MPNSGSPVTRLNMKSIPIFVVCATPGMTWPPRRISMSAGGAAGS